MQQIPAKSEPLIDQQFGWRFQLPLFLASTLNPINNSMIAVALVPISVDMQVSVGRTAVLVSALYITTSIAQPAAGKVAELLGPRRVFTSGTALVITGGLLGGFSATLVGLMLSRVLIGIGTSCAFPSAMLIVRRRARVAGLERPPGGVLGMLQVAGFASASIGLPLGGLLVEWGGWRWVFLVNMPLGLISLLAALRWLPRDAASEADRRGVREFMSDLDLPGLIGFAGAMTALMIFVDTFPSPRWPLLWLSLTLWVVEAWWELRARRPFLDLRLMIRELALTRTYVRYALINFSGYVVFLGLPQWLQVVRDLSALEASMFLMPTMLVSIVATVPLSRANMVRGPLVWAAYSSLAAGALALALPSSAWPWLTPIIAVLTGLALGAGGTGNQLALYHQAATANFGTASGLLRSFAALGAISSSAVASIAYTDDVTNAGMMTIAAAMVVVAGAVLVLSLLDRTLPRP